MNTKGTKLIFALAFSVFLGMGTAWGQVTLDGTITDSEWISNGTSTGGPAPGFGAGHEINAIYSYFEPDSMSIAIAGNVQNGNRIIVFLDTKSGGFNDGSFDRTNAPSGINSFNSSTTFDSGFEADYAIVIGTNGDQSNYFVDLFTLSGTGSNNFIGDASANEVGAAPANSSTTAGFEIKVSNTEIGLENDHLVKAFAVYSSDGGFLSNQFISPGGSSDGNYGSGAITFGSATPDPINLSFSVSISGSAGWRLLSMPITGGTIEDISDDTPVQGVTGGDDAGFDANFIIYDETGAFEQPTNVSTAWGDGLGFGVYFYDNTTNGSSELPVTLDASGAEPGSDVVVDLYSGATGRYTLVGNPFASNVDLANVSANIAISSNMTFWDNEAGSYTTENISGGLVIESWQGYWVQTSSSGAGGQLTYGTADKTSSDADTTHFDKVVASTLKELSFELSSSYNTEKNLTLQVANDASLEWDNYDLLKLGSLKPQNISAAFVGKMDGDDVLKGIEAIPTSLDQEITIPILVDLTGESQTINMSWKGLADLPASWKIELNDYETGEITDLRSVSEYEFEVIVPETQEKVNPLSVINNSFGKLMKAKTGSSPRLGITITPSTSVSNEPEDKPFAFGLEQNYPNPFNPSTTIKYSVGETGPVSITVYNVMGQKVTELINATRGAGEYQVTWNADAQASGIYYYRLVAPGQVITRQMTLIK